MCRCGNKDDSSIKKVKQITRGIIGGILALYVCLIILVNIPAIQQTLGSWVAGSLSKQVGTEVRVGKINLGLFNRLIIDDLYLEDESGSELMKVDRTAVKLNLLALLRNRIRISNAQLFGPTVHIRKDNPKAQANYQFLIDAFKSDDNEAPTPIDLRINSLIVRRGHLTYDVESQENQQTLDMNHLDIKHIDMNVGLRTLTPDSLNLTLKRLNAQEVRSGLELKRLEAHIEGNPAKTTLSELYLELPKTRINIDTLKATYTNHEENRTWNITTQVEHAKITPADLRNIIPELGNFTTQFDISAQGNCSNEHISLQHLLIHTDNGALMVDMNGRMDYPDGMDKDFHANINTLTISNELKNTIYKTFSKDKNLPAIFEQLGTVGYNGNIRQQNKRLTANGELTSDVGNMQLDMKMAEGKMLKAQVSTDNLDVGKLIDSNDLGSTIFYLDFDGQLMDKQLPQGTLKGKVDMMDYKGHRYHDITIDATSKGGVVDGKVDMIDELAKIHVNGTYNQLLSALNAQLHVDHLYPHSLHLTNGMEGQNYSMKADINVKGKDLNSLVGSVNINDLAIVDHQETWVLNQLRVDIKQNETEKQINLHTDFADAELKGQIELDGIIDAFKNQVALHLPSLIERKRSNHNHFDFDVTLTESDFLKHFVNSNYVMEQPVKIKGTINALADTMSVGITAPRISKGEVTYQNTHVSCNNSKGLMSVAVNTKQRNKKNAITYLITADAKDNKLDTFISWEDKKTNMTNGTVYATTLFSDSIGTVNANVLLHKSQLTINDTIWQIAPAQLQIFGKHIKVHDLKMYNDSQSIVINGAVSERMSDSLVVDLENIEVPYITDLVDFDAVRFKGQASGRAKISNVYDDIHLNTNLTVNNFHLQDGRLGTAYLQAFWDNEIEGIRVNGHIIDYYKEQDRTTEVAGFISPSQNNLDLKVTTHNTNAEFLNGFLSPIFRNIKGNANGEIHIIGPLSDINLVGDISADVDMTLRATNVTYHINPADTIRLRRYQFDFEDIRLTDQLGNEGVVNGTLSHKNMKNFKYDFNIAMNNMTVYDEQEFNSDKFYATVYANATIEIHGSDGHPLRMTADVTPTRGSVFAYDTATPDAINTGGFVEFRDATPTKQEKTSLLSKHNDDDDDEEELSEEEDYEYQGDIFMDISIHVNPDCEIKLRMDNLEDGYMSTYGSGTLLAHYHNKSPFSLNGIYNIEGGRYRLYLQDIIYRDLELQQGSNVEFNGNPFDADIHLICHHVINSVPLQDITSGNTFGTNSKVKVICVLDITGQLGNMNFGFDIQLPNVNDETRQLVKSLISTEDEMNMQMIYLLGLGRFYSNEYARAAGNSGSDQAVNTLLSSTISGQINQMLSNVIGQDSKWNFGTGLTTGEKGWDDLDVEGILSGRLLNDRLLINGNFGYRDNALTNKSNFIGDFDVKWRLTETGNTFIKAYNQNNDRYFTKTTLNTQGIGISYQRDFDSIKALFRKKKNVKQDEKKTNRKP